MPEINNSSSSSTKEVPESIMICLDTSNWMENTESPMFKEQLEAIELYCDNIFKSNSETVVGVFGMADLNLHTMIRPTKNIRAIKRAIDGAIIGGNLRLLPAATRAHFHWFSRYHTDLQKRIVFFAGGPLYSPLGEGRALGMRMRKINVRCDVISFGDPYMEKRELFNTFIQIADNNKGNCNVCHVPPEYSVPQALSRSKIINPCVGVGSSSPPPSTHKEMAIQICVKSPPSRAKDANTDCPFCQRVLLILEEKNLPYVTHPIDLDNKPEWFAEANPDGLLPLIRFDGGQWVSNSDVIVEMIEMKHPGTPLITPPYYACLGLRIPQKLLAFLKKENERTHHALLAELMILEEHLLENGPYVNGGDVTTVDLSLAPKLYHLVKACEHFKNWTILEEFTKVFNYTNLLFERPSFKKTKPLPEDVTAGWEDRKLKS
ncbi:dehydroascorbate reductase 2 [Artemisia annua]|uniref:glutathione transferase n=1 Tax=Artemisia annua TaxID=35608 RepID=A0A2U1MJZ0_ARTAN|nr:dehydroascorbate reductase 2 [Artemisia annua]